MRPHSEIDFPADEAFSRFRGTLGQVLKVSKSDLNKMLEDEKTANADKPKRGPKPRPVASDRASRDKG